MRWLAIAATCVALQLDVAPHLDARQHARLQAGAPVVALPDADGSSLTMVAAVRTSISAERLIAWNRQQHRLYAGAFAPAGGRFSSPPRLEDLDQLVIAPADLKDLRNCEPGDCDVKLADDEIRAVRAAIDAAGADWRAAASEAFRRVLVARAFRYARSQADASLPGREPLLFWSKNVVSGAREVISITHVTMEHGRDANGCARVVGTQIYASHYLDASVSYTTVSGIWPDRYLTYVRTADVDVLRGPFGGIVRHFVRKRIRADAPALIEALRQTLESGDPPAAPPSQGLSRR